MFVSYFENHARRTNFLDKIITIRPLIIECEKKKFATLLHIQRSFTQACDSVDKIQS